MLGALGGRVIEAELPVAHAARAAASATASSWSPQQSEQLEELLAELVAAAEREPVAASRALRVAVAACTARPHGFRVAMGANGRGDPQGSSSGVRQGEEGDR